MTELAQPRVPHAGRHHYAPCGEYRPVQGNRDCQRCDPVCPGCGARYHYREEG